MYDKQKVFKNELEWIQNENLRQYTSYLIENFPDYFFEVQASSTGKFHPAYACGEGGLVRHTKVAVYIANQLLQLEQYKNQFTADEQDCIHIALICHDGWKRGSKPNGNYHSFDHPIVAAQNVTCLQDNYNGTVDPALITIIADAIASHMGEWNTTKRNSAVLPKPETQIQQFVHLCDYLASRKYLSFEFSEVQEDYYEPQKYQKKEDLSADIDAFIERCKDLIQQGVDRDLIYQTISDLNQGQRNPKRISSKSVLNRVVGAVEALAV